MVKIIKACLGILLKDNTILIASRPTGKVMAGYWEFPGGKIEAGETYTDALIRELHEELGIVVMNDSLHHIGVVEHQYPHGLAQLDVVIVNQWDGIPFANEGQSFHWHNLSSAVTVSPLLPTTAEVLELLTQHIAKQL